MCLRDLCLLPKQTCMDIFYVYYFGLIENL